MKNKTNRKRLNLPKETVRALQAHELSNVAGGSFSSVGSCYPVLCFPESDPCP